MGSTMNVRQMRALVTNPQTLGEHLSNRSWRQYAPRVSAAHRRIGGIVDVNDLDRALGEVLAQPDGCAYCA
jgi:hypothetical protein